MFFVLSFVDSTVRESYKEYFLPSLEVKDYNVGSMEEIYLINQ